MVLLALPISGGLVLSGLWRRLPRSPGGCTSHQPWCYLLWPKCLALASAGAVYRARILRRTCVLTYIHIVVHENAVVRLPPKQGATPQGGIVDRWPAPCRLAALPSLPTLSCKCPGLTGPAPTVLTGHRRVVDLPGKVGHGMASPHVGSLIAVIRAQD